MGLNQRSKTDVVDTAKVDTKVEKKSYDYDDGGWVPELTVLSKSLPSYVIATAVILSLAFTLNSYFDADGSNRLPMHVDYYYPKTGAFLAFYYVLLLVSRWVESDSHVLFEQIWACNVAMLLSSIGMMCNIPLFTGMSCALVAVDQMCWYIDIGGYLVSGFKKFPIGVAAYLSWPTTSMSKRVTAFHHLWFLPVMLYTLSWRIPANSFLLSAIVGTTLCTLSRFITPFHCLLPKKQGETEHRVLYLNINASYAFWKDVKAGFLHICDFKSPLIYIPYVMLVGNLMLNLPANLLLEALLAVGEKLF